MNPAPPGEAPLADAPLEVTLSEPTILATGHRRFERYDIVFAAPDGGPVHHTRDVVRAGRVVGVLPVDPDRNEIVLIRQFRLPSHLAIGKGDMVEIVAGYVEEDEPPIAAARRECVEEIGVAPRTLLELFSFMPATGMTDEHATLFLATVDASQVPARAGAAIEAEHTRPLRVTIDAALDALARGAVCNGYLIIALQWLALNRSRIHTLVPR